MALLDTSMDSVSVSESYDDSFMSVSRSKYHKKKTISELQMAPWVRKPGPQTSSLEWNESADESFLDVDRKQWQTERFVSHADVRRMKKLRQKQDTETAEWTEAIDESSINVDRKQWEMQRHVSELSKKIRRRPHITELDEKKIIEEFVIIEKKETKKEELVSQTSTIEEGPKPETADVQYYERLRKPLKKKEPEFVRRQYISELSPEELIEEVIEQPIREKPAAVVEPPDVSHIAEETILKEAKEPYEKRVYVSELKPTGKKAKPKKHKPDTAIVPEETVIVVKKEQARQGTIETLLLEESAMPALLKPLVMKPAEQPEITEVVEEEIMLKKKKPEKPRESVPQHIEEVEEIKEEIVTIIPKKEEVSQVVTVESIEHKPVEFEVQQKPKRKVSFASIAQEIPETVAIEKELTSKEVERVTVTEEIISLSKKPEKKKPKPTKEKRPEEVKEVVQTIKIVAKAKPEPKSTVIVESKGLPQPEIEVKQDKKPEIKVDSKGKREPKPETTIVEAIKKYEDIKEKQIEQIQPERLQKEEMTEIIGELQADSCAVLWYLKTS